METNRLKLLSSAFREHPLTCGDLTLRPVTAGSMAILLQVGNGLFTAEELEEGAAPEASKPYADLDALFEFIWVHTAPIEEVLEMVENGDLNDLHKAARRVGLTLSFDDLSSFQEQFVKVALGIQAAKVEAIPEGDGRPGKPPVSPIGSPPSSGPSTPPETPNGSATSSGFFPSVVHSNTSTPPSEVPAPAPAGALILPPVAPEMSPNTFLN